MNLDMAMRYGILATPIDALLVLGIVPLVRAFLRSESLRAPRPVLLLGTGDGGVR